MRQRVNFRKNDEMGDTIHGAKTSNKLVEEDRSRSSRVLSNPLGLSLPRLDTKENKFLGRRFDCKHVFNELTALCPVTRLPDFYSIILDYEPDLKLIELKSLKLYFVSFRQLEILHEEIVNQVLEDFVSAVTPIRARVDLAVNNRGGITTTITREWKRQDKIRVS